MRLSARLLGFLLVFVLFVFSIQSSFAQSPTPQNPLVETTVTPQPKTQNEYLTPNTNPDVPKNLHTWTQNVMIEVMSAMLCQIAGVDPINPDKGCLGVDSETKKIGYVKQSGGAIGLMAFGISSLYSYPIHTGDYVRYLGQNFGIAKPTHAQGVGFVALDPLIPVWTIFRNLTYLFAVIFFSLIGVGIMLRVKIDPRTVMTIQNQIPKVIIALVFITFSFAIVGFLIDLMYISIFLSFSLFSSLAAPELSPASIQGQTVLNVADQLGTWNVLHTVSLAGKDSINGLLGVDQDTLDLAGDIGSLIGFIFNNPDWGTFSVVEMIYNLISLSTSLRIASMIPCAGASVPIIGGLLCGGQTALVAAPFFAGIQYFLVHILPYLIIFLIIGFALLLTLFRILFMLLRAYIAIILDVIFAPLWIMGGLIPGTTSVGVGPWLRDVAANLAVFPAVYVMFLLANVLGSLLSESNPGFAPPLLGNPLAPGFIGAIVSLGLILMTPEAAKLTKAAFKAPKLEIGAGKSVSLAAGIAATPIRKIGGKLFGYNPYTKTWGMGSRILSTEMINATKSLPGGGRVANKVGGIKDAFVNRYPKEGGGSSTTSSAPNPGTIRGRAKQVFNVPPPAEESVLYTPYSKVRDASSKARGMGSSIRSRFRRESQVQNQNPQSQPVQPEPTVPVDEVPPAPENEIRAENPIDVTPDNNDSGTGA